MKLFLNIATRDPGNAGIGQTIKVLNAMSHHLKTYDIEEALQGLLWQKWSIFSWKSKSILYKAWHQLDRIEADRYHRTKKKALYII